MPTIDPTVATLNITSTILFGAIGVVFNLSLLCLISKGFKQRKAYEHILFVASLSNFFKSINGCLLAPYAMLQGDSLWCPLSGLFTLLFYSIAAMLLAVNMLHRYMSLYYPVLCQKLFNARGVMIWSIIIVVTNTTCFCPLLLFDAFGMDAVGTCLFKAKNGGNNPWTMLSMAVALAHSCVTIFCGYFVIKKIRNHVTQILSGLQSQLISESRQIMTLMAILMLWPVITAIAGSALRYLPSNRVEILWASRVLLFFNPTLTAFTPILTMAVIKDYRKTVVKLFKQSSHVTLVEPIHIS